MEMRSFFSLIPPFAKLLAFSKGLRRNRRDEQNRYIHFLPSHKISIPNEATRGMGRRPPLHYRREFFDLRSKWRESEKAGRDWTGVWCDEAKGRRWLWLPNATTHAVKKRRPASGGGRGGGSGSQQSWPCRFTQASDSSVPPPRPCRSMSLSFTHTHTHTHTHARGIE